MPARALFRKTSRLQRARGQGRRRSPSNWEGEPQDVRRFNPGAAFSFADLQSTPKSTPIHRVLGEIQLRVEHLPDPSHRPGLLPHRRGQQAQHGPRPFGASLARLRAALAPKRAAESANLGLTCRALPGPAEAAPGMQRRAPLGGHGLRNRSLLTTESHST